MRRMLFICQSNFKLMATKNSAFKAKKDSQSDIRIKRDINMDNMRIVQKNLVFVSSLPTSIADAQLLKSDQYFGKYGKVTKVVTNPQQPQKKACNYQAYVTYANPIEAAIAIIALDGFNFEQKPLKVSFGTTKYCAHFLRGYECLNADCFYLHEFDKKNQVLNKDTKAIFDEQNEQAMDIVYQNIDQIAERIVRSNQKIPEDGFPSLMEMMEFLVQSKVISSSQLQNLLKKHRSQIPKLMTIVSTPPPTKNKPESPKQTLKLTKSNSFSTVGSPSKAQTSSQCKKSNQKQNMQKTLLKTQNEAANNVINSRQNIQNTQKSKNQKKQKGQKQKIQKQKQIGSQQKTQKHKKLAKQQDQNSKRQQVETLIQKQLLKHIFKLSQKSKSKMQFAGETHWASMNRIIQIVQKNMIVLS